MKRLPAPAAFWAVLLAACAAAGPTLNPSATPTRPPAVGPSASPIAGSATGPPSPTAPPPTLAASRTPTPYQTYTPTPTPHPLSIAHLRQQSYPGSHIVVEQTLEPAGSYDRFIVSYISEGLKIYGLLTVPFGAAPPTGWPVLIFNHGYIPPAQYSPTERYGDYVDALASHGYMVFRPDYRGHGQSEGRAEGGYSTAAYTIDVLNALASVSRYPAADPNRIGMWGHSMGGHITLKAMVIECCAIRAGVIWAGVVAPYWEIVSKWHYAGTPNPSINPAIAGWRIRLMEEYGTYDDNPGFWDSISPNAFLAQISGPLQIHHGTNDLVVPYAFSETLYADMLSASRTVYFFGYERDDHNLSQNFGLAMTRTIEFFDDHVKNR